MSMFEAKKINGTIGPRGGSIPMYGIYNMENKMFVSLKNNGNVSAWDKKSIAKEVIKGGFNELKSGYAS